MSRQSAGSVLAAPTRGVHRQQARMVTVGLAILGLLLAGAAFAPSALADSIATHPTVAQHELDLLNQERAAHHLPALRMNNELISSAYHHNLAMAVANSMSHQCRGEKSLGDRIDAAHYNWSTAGENIGYTTDMTSTGARNLERMMYDEKAPNDGHRLIILSKAYRDVGISIITDNTHHRLWLTEDFGHLM